MRRTVRSVLIIAFLISTAQPRVRSSQGSQPIDWSADDGKRVVELTECGHHVDAEHLSIWFPLDLPRSEMEALAKRLDPAVALLRETVGTHSWQNLDRWQKITIYISADRFVAHSTGRAAVFIPLVRVRDGALPA